MALMTRSKFYFGHEVTLQNNYFDFQETGPILTAELKVGYYSPTEFIIELQRALNEKGAYTYTVNFNRSTRIVSISASSVFAIRGASGPNSGNLLYSLIGYDSSSDLTGAGLYTFTNKSGQEYKPQFFLLDYVSADEKQEAIDSSISVTATGKVEVVSFGIQKFFEFTIDYVNSYPVSTADQIESNINGKSDAINFLQNIVKKGHIEFIPDRDKVNEFYTLLLESTSSSRNGTGYKLQEKIGQGLVGYFSTGLLTWRLIE